MSVTVSEIELPRSAVSATGRTSAKASARRSRTTCVSSFLACAMIRYTARRSGGGGLCGLRLALLHDGEEHVLERIVARLHIEGVDRFPLESRREPPGFRGGVALDDDVQALAEERHAPVLGLGPEQL